MPDISRRSTIAAATTLLIGASARSADIGASSSTAGQAAALPPTLGNGRSLENRLSDWHSAKDYGAIGDERASDAQAMQNAYDAVARSGGGTLYIPQGRYCVALRMTARNVHLQGAGLDSTFLFPASLDGAALNAAYRNGETSSVEIADMTLSGRSGRGILFEAGGQSYERQIEFSGGTSFRRVRFQNADKAIVRRFGCIGLWVDLCNFVNNNFHFHVTSTNGEAGADPMHGGNMVVSRSWLTGFHQAMLYVRSPLSGSGQIVFESNIVELGKGFVFFIDGFSAGRSPGIVVRDQWNEMTATGRGIIIEGNSFPQVAFMFAKDVTVPITFENTPLGRVVLQRSSIATRNCDLTDLRSDIDLASSIVHEDAYAFEGTPVGMARSIYAPIQPSGLRTPWFHMPLPTSINAAWRSNSLFTIDGTTVIELDTRNGPVATQDVADAGLPFRMKSQVVDVGNGNDFLFHQRFAVQPNAWLVTKYVYRLEGDAAIQIQVNGQMGIGGVGTMLSGSWRSLVGIARAGSSGGKGESIAHHVTRAGRLIIGGVAVTQFANLQDAMDFANSGVFPG